MVGRGDKGLKMNIEWKLYDGTDESLPDTDRWIVHEMMLPYWDKNKEANSFKKSLSIGIFQPAFTAKGYGEPEGLWKNRVSMDGSKDSLHWSLPKGCCWFYIPKPPDGFFESPYEKMNKITIDEWHKKMPVNSRGMVIP